MRTVTTFQSCEALGGFWIGNRLQYSSKLLKQWSHPPGLNRRPADYELTLRLSTGSVAFWFHSVA
jgi:hypothetical protein